MFDCVCPQFSFKHFFVQPCFSHLHSSHRFNPSLKNPVRSCFVLLFISPPSALYVNFVCRCVCVVLCWWSLEPWRSAHMAACLPSSPLSLSNSMAAFKLTGYTLKCCVNSFLFLIVLVYLHPASLTARALWSANSLYWLVAFIGIRLVPEQPNKSVIHFRAVGSAAAAKQSYAVLWQVF